MAFRNRANYIVVTFTKNINNMIFKLKNNKSNY